MWNETERENKVGYEKTWKYEVVWGNEKKLEEPFPLPPPLFITVFSVVPINVFLLMLHLVSSRNRHLKLRVSIVFFAISADSYHPSAYGSKSNHLSSANGCT